MKNKKIYALKHPVHGILGFSTTSNDGVNCETVEYTLDTYGEGIWTTPRKSVAEKVAVTNTEWYNADMESPGNPYTKDNLEVVELKVCDWGTAYLKRKKK